MWKLVRTFDDPATWTEPGIRHLASSGPDGEHHRDHPLADEWELYDLTRDPIEAFNLWFSVSGERRSRLIERLATERRTQVPIRNRPWPYATRRSAKVGS
jgi:hypothetical protein